MSISKHPDLEKCLHEFGQKNNMELEIIESFAGQSVLFSIPGAPHVAGDWRLWISFEADSKNQFVIHLDCVDQTNRKLGLNFPCLTVEMVREHLNVAWDLAHAANSVPSEKTSDHFKNQIVLDALRTNDQIFTRFADTHQISISKSPSNGFSFFEIPSTEGPAWTVWVNDKNKLEMSRFGFNHPTDTGADSLGYMCFNSSKTSLEELLKLVASAAKISC